MKRIKFKEIENGNEHIGIRITSKEDYTILIPKYFLDSEEINEINNQTKDKLKKLFKAWNIYQKRRNSDLGAKFNDDDNLYDMNISLEIIKDFIEYGLYIEQENTTKITNTGKMNFKKTINLCNPLYTQQGPIYLDYITDTKKPNDQNFIRLVQSTVINEISDDFGWLIGFNFKFPIQKRIILNKKISLKLEQTLNQSFNSRKINLIKLLIKYININSKGLIEGKELFIGVAYKFWEDMVDYVVGNVSKSELKKYFYVKHAYVSDNNIQALPELRPDSIYKDENNIVIIDSKYYINNSLPDNDDINKQIIYFLKAYEIFQQEKEFGNCFILPTDNISHKSKKEAKFDIEVTSTWLSINLIYANLNEILVYYIQNKKNFKIIKELISSN